MSTGWRLDVLTDRTQCGIGKVRSVIRMPFRTVSLLIAVLTTTAVINEPAAARQHQVAPDSLATQQVRGLLGRGLDSLLTFYEAHGFAGTILIVRRGEIVLLKGYGFADIPRRVRNGPATRFEMNSMTKMFTGVSILQLAAAGKIRLDAPIGQYLGDFPAVKNGATVHQLAMHTAGLAIAGAPLAGGSRYAFVASMKAAPIESPPGERYRYTNAGYSLLAAIIEVASGQTYEGYLRQHIFALANMRSPVFRTQVPVADTLFAHGHVGSSSGPIPGPLNPYQWGTIGAGGVWATVGDMYRWVLAVESGNVVPPQYHGLLLAPPSPPSLEAFGWHVYAATDTSRARIDKGGGSDDFASQLIHFPRDSVTIVWASNNLVQHWRQTLNRALPEMIFTGTTHAPLPR
jgi:CubicO group peptidase (beta-lactamase class C family)